MQTAWQQMLLREMGITNWSLRGQEDSAPAPDVSPPFEAGVAAVPRQGRASAALASQPRPSSNPATPSPRAPVATPRPTDAVDVARAPAAARALDVSNLDWTALRDVVSACQACELHRTRTQTVFGVGSEQANLLIIGEAPGQNEDLQGEPFVGRAGQLLNAMLAAIGLERDQVYIANTLKCRPPGNRDPKPDETALCSGFLARQFALLEPKVVLAVGRIAAQSILESTAPLGRLRGSPHVYPGTSIPLIITYHPAYLLRSPAQKRNAWSDLLMLKRYLTDDTGH